MTNHSASSILKSIFVLSVFLTAFLSTESVSAVDIEYKEYQPARTSSTGPYFEISFDAGFVEFFIFDSDGNRSSTGYYRRDLKLTDKKVLVDERTIIDKKGLHILGVDLKWDLVYSVQVSESHDRTLISFKTKGDDSDGSRRRRGNIFEYSRNIDIDSDEFIRGSIIAVLGDIRIDGEVNRDIIALFGDVRLGGDAVARGDIAAMSGEVDVSKTASIYGEVFETKSDRRTRAKRRGRRGRFYRSSRDSDFGSGFVYNRVDGAHPWFEYKFTDSDSLLPTVALKAGYAFNSERWRYDVSVEQTFLRDLPITLGGGLHRRLASDDRWLLDKTENTVFAILANEDYMDYYEAEGGSMFIRIKPVSNLILEARYQYDETNWLSARHHLWTLFGGSKLFSDNFDSVEDSVRLRGIDEIDTTVLGSVYLSAHYDNVGENRHVPFSGTRASFELEWSDPDFNSDFDFHRYTVAATQYLRLNRRAMLSLGVRYGTSSGYLPMHKRFYLGGLSTLRGYQHKEFMGTEFWMANAEYRFELPGTSTDFGLMYDVARIANDLDLNQAEVLHSVGLAWYISDDLRISLAKRFDSAENDDPRLLVRLTEGINWEVSADW